MHDTQVESACARRGCAASFGSPQRAKDRTTFTWQPSQERTGTNVHAVCEQAAGHREEKYVQVSACEALARIAEGTPESAAQMVEEGMIGLVKQAMEAHPEEKYVHVSACEALARIAEGARESAVQMVEEGMIGLVKHAMQAHPEEKQVQGRACDALTGIALGGPECAAQMVEKLRGQRLRASRKAPIQYSACAKRAHIFSSESSVWRGRPRTNLATWRRSFPLAIDGNPFAHHVAKDAEVSHAVARLVPQSRRLGTAPRGCLRWRCQCAWSSNDWYTT